MNTPKFEFDDNGYYPTMLERYLRLAEEILRNNQLQGRINVENLGNSDFSANANVTAVQEDSEPDTVVFNQIINGTSEQFSDSAVGNLPELIDQVVMEQQASHQIGSIVSDLETLQIPAELENIVNRLTEVFSVNMTEEYLPINSTMDQSVTVETARRFEEITAYLEDMKGSPDWPVNYHHGREEIKTGDSESSEVTNILRELLPRLDDMVRAVEQNSEILSTRLENGLELND